MATTNDSAVVDLGRLKTFKSKLDASMGSSSSVNAATTPLPSNDGYVQAESSTFAVAIGNGSKAKMSGCVSLGIKAIAESEESVAIGSGSNATGEQTVCVGGGCAAQGNSNTAIGNAAVAIGGGGNTAVGADAVIDVASSSVSIGTQSYVSGDVDFAVALGAKSVADADKTVSMGNDELTRRIVNVTDPINPTDAATKGYVDGIKTHILFIDNFGVTLTIEQLNEIKKHWPNVIICSGNSAAFSPVDRRIDPSNGKSLSFVFANAVYTDSGNGNIAVGTNNENYLVLQLNIDAVTGTIEPNYHVSLFPLIATNPRFSDASTVKAVGANSIAAGNNSSAMSNYAIALGFNSLATDIGAIAIGAKANAEHFGGIALGNSSATDKDSQVSIGDKASGITRYLSNVKDPVEDQDAATRYWTKNADRSDVFAPYFTMTIPGSGTGEFYLEANADLNWIAVRGYAFWYAFSDVWAVMTNLPGESNNNWWIKTELKVPDKMIPKTNFIGYAAVLEFIGSMTVPYYSDKMAVGTDGYIYLTSWSTNYDSTPLGVLCLGHRFYM